MEQDLEWGRHKQSRAYGDRRRVYWMYLIKIIGREVFLYSWRDSNTHLSLSEGDARGHVGIGNTIVENALSSLVGGLTLLLVVTTTFRFEWQSNDRSFSLHGELFPE